MKYITLIGLLAFTSCSRSETEVQSSVYRLLSQERTLKSSVVDLETRLEAVRGTITEYETIVASDGNPLYLLTIKSKKSSFTMDLGKHFRDSLNAFTFTIPVDKAFYNSVSIGDRLADSAVWGSSFGSVRLTVEKKEMRVRR